MLRSCVLKAKVSEDQSIPAIVIRSLQPYVLEHADKMPHSQNPPFESRVNHHPDEGPSILRRTHLEQ
jgi:hypothetical protein